MLDQSIRLLVIAACATSLAACGGGGGSDGGPYQTSYIIGPQTCGSLSSTSLTIYLTEKTNYCTYLKSNTSSWCPPGQGERVMQLVVFDSSLETTVGDIAPGTYTTEDRLQVYGILGDGTNECPAASGDGTVTLTEVSRTTGVKGTYSVTIEDVTYEGTIGAGMCWAGTVPCQS